MRDLTPQEIADAGDNKHYFIDSEFGPIYSRHMKSFTQPIPRKEFDISGYEFSDGDINIHNAIGDRYELYVTSKCIELNKQDAIALAKHFKLTASDLL